MNRRLGLFGFSGVLTAVALVACSGGSQSVASKYVATAVIGASGGKITVSGTADVALEGTTIVIPANALASDTTINIGLSTDVINPSGSKAAGPVLDFEPSGTKFAVPVVMSIPTTATSASSSFVEAKEADGTTSELAILSIAGGLATFHASGFTDFGVSTSLSTSSSCTSNSDCAAGQTCVNGVCSAATTGDDAGTCGDGVCTAGETCESCPSDCGSCATNKDASTGCTTDVECAAGQVCVAGECSVSGSTDACAPATCASLGLSCGEADDGCGGTLDCGACGQDAGSANDADAAPCSDVECNGVCVDLSNDSNNCGGCGDKCAAGTTCVNGACAA